MNGLEIGGVVLVVLVSIYFPRLVLGFIFCIWIFQFSYWWLFLGIPLAALGIVMDWGSLQE